MTTIPLGDAFQVNTTTYSDQWEPHGVALANGDFVVVWRNAILDGSPPESWSIRAQVYSAAGARAGGEISVDSSGNNVVDASHGVQNAPQVVALDGGGFAAAWRSFIRPPNEQGADVGSSIKVQVFGNDGSKVGGEVLVNSAATGFQASPHIVSLSNGGFVVAWDDPSQGSGGGAAGDASGLAVKAQVFSAAGAKQGSEILVNTATAGAQEVQAVTSLHSGGFVVTWVDASHGVGGAGGDASGLAIKAQVFSATSARVGQEIRVNTAFSGDQTDPEVVALAHGGFVVTWTDQSHIGGDDAGDAVKAQVFSDAGAKIGGEILVNTATAGDQNSQEVTALADGGFVVAWTDDSRGAGGATGDTVRSAIKAQVFDAMGSKVGGEILVNTDTIGIQDSPHISSLEGGYFVIAWADRPSALNDSTNDYGGPAYTKAQIFTSLGVPQGDQFEPAPGNTHTLPLISLPGGGFAAAWDTYTGRTAGPRDITEPIPEDTNGLTVRARIFGVVGDGDDVLTLGSSNDTVSALGGADTIHGGAGDDSIDGGSGVSYLRGDEGNDTIVGGADFDDINGNMGDDTASGGAGGDWVVGGKDNDLLHGDTGNDIVYGNLGNDTCYGDDGNDIVRGGKDNDVVYGGAGDDWLSGDKGDDTLTGGTGADVFHTFGDAGIDRVTDFNRAEGDRVMVDPGTVYSVAQVGADTVISMDGGGQMILVGVSMNSLSGDWIFGA